MTDETDHAFLNAGVLHFADALAAVEEFRRQLRTRIHQELHRAGEGVWTIESDIKPTKSGVSGDWCGAGGRLSIFEPVHASVVIDVGLRWSWPRLPAHPIVLCAVFPPEWPLKTPKLPSDAGVELVWDGRWANFYVVPNAEAPDLGGDLRRLLDGVRAVVLATEPPALSAPT